MSAWVEASGVVVAVGLSLDASRVAVGVPAGTAGPGADGPLAGEATGEAAAAPSSGGVGTAWLVMVAVGVRAVVGDAVGLFVGVRVGVGFSLASTRGAWKVRQPSRQPPATAAARARRCGELNWAIRGGT
jgi:hypothetical protein